MSHYTVLVLGFIAAIAALGFEIGNLALLVSALGVGIGFGMQNMVNNFISGLILLFERPIKVGDLISLDSLLGKVARIGIRSSTIRTFDGADVIVPNGDLISNRVTNWTLSDTRRRVTFPVGVKYGTSARRVIELLEETARANPAILDEPAPVGLFTAFGDSALEFELRVWSESPDALTIVRSEMAVGIQDALAAANIEVPFPQRDLHLKTVPRQSS
jgi:small-conductance mechanosensitive channel